MAKLIKRFMSADHPFLKGGPRTFTPFSPPRTSTAPPLFTVSSYDNWETYADDDGPSIVGKYHSPEAALSAARAVVHKSLSDLLAQRIGRGQASPSAEELFSDWIGSGNSAFISGPKAQPPISFSSSNYAREEAARMCIQRDNHPSIQK
jgi:hypothetical protein